MVVLSENDWIYFRLDPCGRQQCGFWIQMPQIKLILLATLRFMKAGHGDVAGRGAAGSRSEYAGGAEAWRFYEENVSFFPYPSEGIYSFLSPF